MRSALKRKNYKTVRESDKNKEQKMKKMLLLLASLACFGLLASCSDETQDVYVTNSVGNYDAAGTVTGTMTVAGSSSTYTIDSSRYAFVSSSNTTSEVVDYTLKVPYTTTTGTTTTASTQSVAIKKIDGKYYYAFDDDKTKITDSLDVNGSIEGDFTVTSIKINNTTTISNLKFEKK